VLLFGGKSERYSYSFAGGRHAGRGR